MPVSADFDYCEWAEAKKETLTRIRKLAKANNESKELTNAKLEAVRKQDPENGRVAVFSYKNGETTVHDAVVIKKKRFTLIRKERKE